MRGAHGAVLKDGPQGSEPCWSSDWKDGACGVPTQDQIGKDGILWEGLTWSWGRVTMERQRQSITSSSQSPKPVPLHHLDGGGRGWRESEGVLSLVLVSHCSNLLLLIIVNYISLPTPRLFFSCEDNW